MAAGYSSFLSRGKAQYKPCLPLASVRETAHWLVAHRGLAPGGSGQLDLATGPAFVDSFEKTPTERIRKENLSNDIGDCWDLEKSG